MNTTSSWSCPHLDCSLALEHPTTVSVNRRHSHHPAPGIGAPKTFSATVCPGHHLGRAVVHLVEPPATTPATAVPPRSRGGAWMAWTIGIAPITCSRPRRWAVALMDPTSRTMATEVFMVMWAVCRTLVAPVVALCLADEMDLIPGRDLSATRASARATATMAMTAPTAILYAGMVSALSRDHAQDAEGDAKRGLFMPPSRAVAGPLPRGRHSRSSFWARGPLVPLTALSRPSRRDTGWRTPRVVLVRHQHPYAWLLGSA